MKGTLNEAVKHILDKANLSPTEYRLACEKYLSYRDQIRVVKPHVNPIRRTAVTSPIHRENR